MEEFLKALFGSLATGTTNALNTTAQAAPMYGFLQMLQSQSDKTNSNLGEANRFFQGQAGQYQQNMNNAMLPADTVSRMQGALENRAYASPVSPTVSASASVPGMTPTPSTPAKQQLTELIASMPKPMNAPPVPGTTAAPATTISAPTGAKFGTFNPYASGQMGNGIAPEMLQMLQGIAQGGMTPNAQWGNNNLMNQLALRGGTRDMRSGALTPLMR